MPWTERTVKVWKTCWKWGFIPYPCRKRVKKQCCVGTRKVRCYVFVGENWFCCDGKEIHFWSTCWGVGSTIAGNQTVCRKNIGSETPDCPNTIGDAPPSMAAPPPNQSSYLVANIGIGGGIIGLLGAIIGTITAGGLNGTVAGAIGGLIVGAISGAGRGRRWGCLVTLIVLILVILLFYFVMIR